MLPNFICVGPGRAGTSWLYEVFLEHPQVCMAKNIKETQFFNENYERGIKWYERSFKDCGGALAVGEISNLYISNPDVSIRIKELMPYCKIIICMRNPHERIQSIYTFKLRERALDCSFEEALQKMPEIMQEDRCFSLVKPYYDLFTSKNIFLMFYDDLVNKPFDLCRDLFRFLGVNEGFIPTVINEKVNRAAVPKYLLVPLLTKGAAKLMRTMRLYRPLTWAKRSDALKSLLFREYDYKKEILMTSKVRAMIDPVVLPELDQLEVLIGRSLYTWRNGADSEHNVG